MELSGRIHPKTWPVGRPPLLVGGSGLPPLSPHLLSSSFLSPRSLAHPKHLIYWVVYLRPPASRSAHITTNLSGGSICPPPGRSPHDVALSSEERLFALTAFGLREQTSICFRTPTVVSRTTQLSRRRSVCSLWLLSVLGNRGQSSIGPLRVLLHDAARSDRFRS